MESFSSSHVTTPEAFKAKLPELEAYLTGHWLSDFSNFSSFVFHSLPDLNWVGFYLFDGTKLRLGPFVGKPACTEIRIGRGVCGTAFETQKALLVRDVADFPGHIACDSASRSELVLPLIRGGICYGVLDLDSPSIDRFRATDLEGLEGWISALQRNLTPELASQRPWG